MSERDWIEKILTQRAPRKIEHFEVEFLAEHIEKCATCLLWETRKKGSYCDSYRLYTTDCKAYTFYEDAPNPVTQGLRLRFKQTQQRLENPNLHRMLPSWLRWTKVESPGFGGYLRTQSDGDTFQIVYGDGLYETLLYHLHP